MTPARTRPLANLLFSACERDAHGMLGWRLASPRVSYDTRVGPTRRLPPKRTNSRLLAAPAAVAGCGRGAMDPFTQGLDEESAARLRGWGAVRARRAADSWSCRDVAGRLAAARRWRVSRAPRASQAKGTPPPAATAPSVRCDTRRLARSSTRGRWLCVRTPARGHAASDAPCRSPRAVTWTQGATPPRRRGRRRHTRRADAPQPPAAALRSTQLLLGLMPPRALFLSHR